jgi:squalene synthase HpnC
MVTDATRRAYAACERTARAHYENFPVASRLLPAAMRPHVAAVYAFARVADDFADEGGRPDEERLRLLDMWHARLQAASGNRSSRDGGGDGATASQPRGDAHDQIFLALGETIRRCRLPVGLFEDLLSAFRQDVTTHRYEDFAAVLDYCRRSANPVGRLVLRIAGHDDARLDAASDDVCTALQLTNFWQDLARDWSRGRLYVPLGELRAAGAAASDLDRGGLSAAWVAVMTSLGARTRALFDRGRYVCDAVRGRLGLELRLTWLGGRRILDRLEVARYDVFGARPSLGGRDVAAMAWAAAAWRRRGGGR